MKTIKTLIAGLGIGAGLAHAQCPTGTMQPTTLFESDFEREDPNCWSNVDNSGCGGFEAITSNITIASGSGVPVHSGSKSVLVTHSAEGTNAHADVRVRPTDTLIYRTYIYFASDYDFGQGVRIAKFRSRGPDDSVYQDLMLQVRSPQSSAQCGMTNSSDIGFYHNSGGSGFAPTTVSYNFARGQWYAIKAMLIYNKTGLSDGALALWINGTQLINQTGMTFRGSIPSAIKFNDVQIGGYYANTANGNTCPNPATPAKYWLDDILITTTDDNVNPIPTGKTMIYSSSFENEEPTCWNNTSVRSGCGVFTGLAPKITLNTSSSFSHISGSKSLKITHDADETYGYAQLNFNTINAAPTDTLWYSAWYYFASNYDFGQGQKIARFLSYGGSQMYNDIILVVRSAQNSTSTDPQQCGPTPTNSLDLGIISNGTAGTAAGTAFSPMMYSVNLSRGTWHNIKTNITYNKVGLSDGKMELYLDGSLVASRTGLTNRGATPANVKWNQVLVGGWYSNSHNNASCKNPDPNPAVFYLDDLKIGAVDPD